MSASDAKAPNPHRRIWAIAAPAMVAGSTAPLVGLVDTWAIGHSPRVSELAAVGAGATLFNMLFWAFGFLRMGTTGLVAQAKGAGDRAVAARFLAQSLGLGLALGLLLWLLKPSIWQVGLTGLAVPTPVIPPLEAYFGWRLWAAPLSLTTYAITGYLIGRERAQGAMAVQLALNLSNGVANLVFVLGFSWGAAGVAAGTLVAEAVAVSLGIYLIHRDLGLNTVLKSAGNRRTWQVASLTKLLNVGGWLFIRTLILLLTLASVTRFAAEISPTALAASHVLTTYMFLISLGLDSFAYAAESLAGAAYGARDRAGFLRWFMRTSLWAGLCASLYALVFGIGGSSITALITTLGDVRALVGSAALPLTLLPLVAVACYQFDGVFVGATASRAMAFTMAAAALVYVGSVGPLSKAFGFVGLWWAVLIFMGARGVFQALWFPRLLRTADR